MLGLKLIHVSKGDPRSLNKWWQLCELPWETLGNNLLTECRAFRWYFNSNPEILIQVWWRLVQSIVVKKSMTLSWWRHQMETFSALPNLCAGNSPVTGEFPAQRPVTRCFDVFFDLRLNKRLSKQSWGWWFETPSCPLWCHCNYIRHS